MNGYELRELSDVALVDAYREGNADAFGVLFERYKDKMWAVALRTTRDQELAADAVQEGFIAAFRRIDSFRGDAQFSTWLHRIIVNSSLDRLRRLKPTQEWPEYDIADKRDEHHDGRNVQGLLVHFTGQCVSRPNGRSKERSAEYCQ